MGADGASSVGEVRKMLRLVERDTAVSFFDQYPAYFMHLYDMLVQGSPA